MVGSTWTATTFDLLASQWIPIPFNGTATGASVPFLGALGVAGPLAAGNVVAMGIFMDMPDNQAARFDSFSLSGTLSPPPPLEVVPEPGSAILLLGAAAVLVARRRRILPPR